MKYLRVKRISGNDGATGWKTRIGIDMQHKHKTCSPFCSVCKIWFPGNWIFGIKVSARCINVHLLMNLFSDFVHLSSSIESFSVLDSDGWAIDWKPVGCSNPFGRLNIFSFLLFSRSSSLSYASRCLSCCRGLSHFYPFVATLFIFSASLFLMLAHLRCAVRLGGACQLTFAPQSPNPSTKTSILPKTAFFLSPVSPSFALHIVFSKLSNTLSLCILFRFPYQRCSDNPSVTRLEAAPHHYALSSPFTCWFSSGSLTTEPLTLMDPEARGTHELIHHPLLFPQHVLLWIVALLINYRVNLAIMSVKLWLDSVALLVCALRRGCSVFLHCGCEIVRVLIILFYKGIKGAAGTVGPIFIHARTRAYTPTHVFWVLLWICSIIKTVKRML